MERQRRIRIAGIAVAGVLVAGAVGAWTLGARLHDGPPQKDMAVDAAMRKQVVDAIVDDVTRLYVYPDKGAQVAARLRGQLQHGEFDGITSAAKLADALTDSLQHDTHDRHLEVRYFADEIPVPRPGDEDSPEDKAAQVADQQRFNFGFETVGRLKCDIGYIDLHGFSPADLVKSRVEAAMALVADTRGLIIDLRRNGGGDADAVMLWASYFYDKPTHLNDIWMRDAPKAEERWTTASVSGLRYGEARPIYLLTSEDTFSAGEDFAYALKNNGRATLVGETTGGGAHPGGRRRLGAHFMMNVPMGRSINAVTHTDWEGVGVVPDVPVAAKKALEVAQVAILKKMLVTEPTAEWQRKIRDRLHDLE